VGTPTNVPEPATLGLLGIGLALSVGYDAGKQRPNLSAKVICNGAAPCGAPLALFARLSETAIFGCGITTPGRWRIPLPR